MKKPLFILALTTAITTVMTYNAFGTELESTDHMDYYQVQDAELIDMGLDEYDDVNTAENEKGLKTILENNIKHHPLKISVRINKSISQESINNSMSNLFKYDYVSEIAYGQLYNDKTEEYYILNLNIKYKETPTDLAWDFTNKVYNTASKINFNVYAMYGSQKTNITNDVLIHSYDKEGINIKNGVLTFKKPGKYNIALEFQGIRENVSITALNAEAFKYITDKKCDTPVNVKIYDQYIDFNTINQMPYIQEGRTMVPLRAVLEVLNFNVKWDEDLNSAVVEHEDTEIIIPINSNTALVNGSPYTLDVPAVLINDRIMVPLRFVSETIGKTVTWDDPNKTVLIN